MSDPLLTPEQAAKALGVSPSTLKRWRTEGRGPKWVRFGARVIRYQLNDCSEPSRITHGAMP